MQLEIPKTVHANDDAIVMAVEAYERNMMAIEGMSDEEWTDEKADAYSAKADRYAKRAAKIPADSVRGVAAKVKWLRRDENRPDKQNGKRIDDILASIFADIERMA